MEDHENLVKTSYGTECVKLDASTLPEANKEGEQKNNLNWDEVRSVWWPKYFIWNTRNIIDGVSNCIFLRKKMVCLLKRLSSHLPGNCSPVRFSAIFYFPSGGTVNRHSLNV